MVKVSPPPTPAQILVPLPRGKHYDSSLYIFTHILNVLGYETPFLNFPLIFKPALYTNVTWSLLCIFFFFENFMACVGGQVMTLPTAHKYSAPYWGWAAGEGCGVCIQLETMK